MKRRMRGWVAVGLMLGGAQVHAARPTSEPEENLIAFVGEKFSVEELPPETDPNILRMDNGFKARYRIKKILYGHYDGDTIEFEAYDHYGRPPFEAFPHSLLYVSRRNGKLYHQKYQFDPVFRNAAGEWVGCGPVGERQALQRKGIVEARPMAFGPDAYHPIRSHWSARDVAALFARKDFRVEGDKAYCLTGTPVQDLFEVTKRTVFKARGMFGGEAED
ncbi:hypothetical protein [Lysobacter capsici]|uniref:hypothetical protein n=1 Tax=Lysobacter capsici TaxID=435897 RepID=UPI000BBA56ED|nr:hypothetical protein [Lysobacter capsici]ATE73160.1 hypothetical protein CNO08_18440 [Lysobacter capsici]